MKKLRAIWTRYQDRKAYLKWANALIAKAEQSNNQDYQKCLGMNCDKCRCGYKNDCE